jgi:hypothetical protein
MAEKDGNPTVWILVILGIVVLGGLVLFGGIICAGVLVVGPMRAEQAQVEACQSQIARLDAAVEAYRLRYGQYPPDLETLLEPGPDGAPPLLSDPNLLNDPWGIPIEYDLNGVNNNGTRPDIYSDQHDEIGNWQLPPPPQAGGPAKNGKK